MIDSYDWYNEFHVLKKALRTLQQKIEILSTYILVRTALAGNVISAVYSYKSSNGD